MIAGVKGSKKKMVFGKWRFVKKGRRKAGRRKGVSRRRRRPSLTAAVGGSRYRVKRVLSCVPAGINRLRCDIEVGKKPVGKAKIQIPGGVMGVHGRRRRKRR
jgi:hypothetical protein